MTYVQQTLKNLFGAMVNATLISVFEPKHQRAIRVQVLSYGTKKR